MYIDFHGFEVYSIAETFGTWFPDMSPDNYNAAFDRIIEEVLKSELNATARAFYEGVRRDRRFAVDSRADLYDIGDQFEAAQQRLLQASGEQGD